MQWLQILPTLLPQHLQRVSHSRVQKYEANWPTYEDYIEVVGRMWQQDNGTEGFFKLVIHKLKKGMTTLRSWSKGK